jgi:hypothetical protein
MTIWIVLEEIVRDLEIISQENDFIEVSISRPELVLDLNNAIHYSKEAAWKYLETLEKMKPALDQKLAEGKAKTVSQFLHYCQQKPQDGRD